MFLNFCDGCLCTCLKFVLLLVPGLFSSFVAACLGDCLMLVFCAYLTLVLVLLFCACLMHVLVLDGFLFWCLCGFCCCLFFPACFRACLMLDLVVFSCLFWCLFEVRCLLDACLVLVLVLV